MGEPLEPTTVPLRPLALMERRAVGGPVSARLLAAYFAVSIAAWAAAGVTSLFAAADLARGDFLAAAPVLGVHLVALGALPFAVAGGSFHLLPVMLRNDLPSQRALWAALPLLGGGLLVAGGLGGAVHALVWVGVAAIVCALGIVLGEIGTLVVRAPRGRALIASRVGVGLSGAHAVAALCIGVLIFEHDSPFAGVSYGRWLLIHLHVALVGWIVLLVLAVGRNLVPMLAQAPAAPRRRLPVDEVVLAVGLWVLVGGLAASSRVLTLAGAVVVLTVLARFGRLVVAVARSRRASLEAPLLHVLLGVAFLGQAAVLGLVGAAGAGGAHLAVAYVVLLLVGWAGGVVAGHVAKLMSLSLWVWWPPGPRPKQAALYPRRLALAEAAAFGIGIELLALGALVGSVPVARVGAAAFCASALVGAAAVAVTLGRRSR